MKNICVSLFLFLFLSLNKLIINEPLLRFNNERTTHGSVNRANGSKRAIVASTSTFNMPCAIDSSVDLTYASIGPVLDEEEEDVPEEVELGD